MFCKSWFSRQNVRLNTKPKLKSHVFVSRLITSHSIQTPKMCHRKKLPIGVLCFHGDFCANPTCICEVINISSSLVQSASDFQRCLPVFLSGHVGFEVLSQGKDRLIHRWRLIEVRPVGHAGFHASMRAVKLYVWVRRTEKHTILTTLRCSIIL